VGFGRKRRGGDEEDFLLRDPVREVGIDILQLLTHTIRGERKLREGDAHAMW
jgi:hypothetical protein